jgi:hypothetical protein
MSFRITGGVDYDKRERNTIAIRSVSFREETEEVSYRAELRRSLSETITGGLAFVHSERDGSPFLTTVLNGGGVGSNLIAPIHLADRDRDKVRLSLNWAPSEPLSLQFFADYANDDYDSRTAQELGRRSGKAENYSIDAAYVFSDTWQANAWVSRNNNRIEQATCVNASNAGVCPASAAQPVWSAKLRNLGDAVGFGLRAQATDALEIGADVQHSAILDEFQLEAITPGATVESLPDISTRLTTARLYGKYALRKNAGIRVDYVYDRIATNDWTWTTWVYSDGTRVIRDPDEKIHFIGVSAYYKWW